MIFQPTWGFADSVVQHIREEGLTVPIIGYIVGGVLFPGAAPEGMYNVVPGRPPAAMPGYADFAAKYRAAGLPRDPTADEWTTLAYDATNLIIAGIRRAAETGAVTRGSVAAAMEAFRDEPYQGVMGAIQFDEFGDLLDQLFHFRKVVNGEWVDVER